MHPLIEATGLHKSYGAIPVLKNISLSVAERETFAIIGPNGAGKTTLFKVITGETSANQGTVRYAGDEVTSLPADRRAALGFGRTFQVARVFGSFTTRENIVIAVEARRRNAGETLGRWYDFRPSPLTLAEADEAAVSVGLEDKRDVQASFLSHGDKKRLEIAITLALKPRVLMLDEPTAGMSPTDRAQSVELIAKVRAAHGVTVMLTEHDMDVVFGLANRIMVLNYGEIIAVGTPAEIRTNPAVREVYLGEESGHA